MAFTRLTSKMVRADVTPGVPLFSQRGAMLAYTGPVVFTPSLTDGQGGLGGMIGRRVAGESVPLMTVEFAPGAGGPVGAAPATVMFGHGGHHVHVVDLAGETLYVESDRLLAFEGSLRQGTMFMGSRGGVMGVVRGQVTGQGLFTTTLTGHGSVAVMAHGGVFELPVVPGAPVHVDPQAYVAHRGEVANRLSASVGWREVVGRGSGESFQLELSGNGAVYVQASEEKL